MEFMKEDFNGSVEWAIDKLNEDMRVLNAHVMDLLKEINKNKKQIARINKVGNEAIDKLNEVIDKLNEVIFSLNGSEEINERT